MLTFQILHLSLRPHDNQTQPSHITAIRSPYNLRPLPPRTYDDSKPRIDFTPHFKIRPIIAL